MGAVEADINDLAYWFPKIERPMLNHVPRTTILHTDSELMALLDGELPAGFDDLVHDIYMAGVDMGVESFFLRTGHTSGKHSWDRTCFIKEADDEETIGWHVSALVEESACAGIFGLPTNTWVVRELIDTVPAFYCYGYGHFPVVREFRVFARQEGTEDAVVEEIYPYWPEGAVEQGMPDAPNWKHILREISALTEDEHETLSGLASRAVEAVGGFWSVDFLQDSAGKWWLTDMADGDQSYRPGHE